MRFRAANAADLEMCRALLHPEYRLPMPADRLLELWERLLKNECNRFVVVEDTSRPHPSGIEAFFATVFVTDTFVKNFCGARRPALSAAIYERILAGRSPVLTAAEVRAANSARGLNLVLLHLGVRTSDIRDRHQRPALRIMSDAFLFFHAGYRLKVLLAEAHGDQSVADLQAGGFRPLDGDPQDARLAAGRPDGGPHCLILRKEWVAPAITSPLLWLFHAPPPRLGLSRAEQRVLLGALVDQSNVETSASGACSVDGVKRAWRRIYERLALSDPYLLGSSGGSPLNGHRGVEKRRHVVAYFRHHLEELRPVTRPSASSRRTGRRPSPHR